MICLSYVYYIVAVTNEINTEYILADNSIYCPYYIASKSSVLIALDQGKVYYISHPSRLKTKVKHNYYLISFHVLD